MATVKNLITSLFGDTKGRTKPHAGVDTAFGVYAAADGKVIATRSDIPNTHTGLGINTAELGNYIKIQHADGYMTMHAHLNNGSPAVKVGSSVKKGQLLGIAGNTGQSSGCHEHFQVEKNNVPINPMPVYNGQLNLKAPSAEVNTSGFNVGDAVIVKPNSKWSSNLNVASFIYGRKMFITSIDINSETVIISTSKDGAATGRIKYANLTKA